MKLHEGFICLFIAFSISIHSDVFSQVKNVQVDQEIVQTTTISDPKLIKFFADDFMIPEKRISKMVIYDLSGDGFGERDIARTFPGGKTYLLTPGKDAQRIMNKWNFGGNVKFTAGLNDSPENFENVPDSVKAMGGIFSSLLTGLRRNYKGIPVKLHLEQENDVITFEMWGYNREKMKYNPPPLLTVPEKVPVLKLVYLEKTIIDSVFVPK